METLSMRMNRFKNKKSTTVKIKISAHIVKFIRVKLENGCPVCPESMRSSAPVMAIWGGHEIYLD